MKDLAILVPNKFVYLDFDKITEEYLLYDAKTSCYYRLNVTSREIWELIGTKRLTRPSLIEIFRQRRMVSFVEASKVIEPFIDYLILKNLAEFGIS